MHVGLKSRYRAIVIIFRKKDFLILTSKDSQCSKCQKQKYKKELMEQLFFSEPDTAKCENCTSYKQKQTLHYFFKNVGLTFVCVCGFIVCDTGCTIQNPGTVSQK